MEVICFISTHRESVQIGITKINLLNGNPNFEKYTYIHFLLLLS